MHKALIPNDNNAADQVSSHNTWCESPEPTQCTLHVGDLIVQLNGKSEILFSNQRQAADRLKAPGDGAS